MSVVTAPVSGSGADTSTDVSDEDPSEFTVDDVDELEPSWFSTIVDVVSEVEPSALVVDVLDSVVTAPVSGSGADTVDVDSVDEPSEFVVVVDVDVRLHGAMSIRLSMLFSLFFSAVRARKMLIFTCASLIPVMSPISW